MDSQFNNLRQYGVNRQQSNIPVSNSVTESQLRTFGVMKRQGPARDVTSQSRTFGVMKRQPTDEDQIGGALTRQQAKKLKLEGDSVVSIDPSENTLTEPVIRDDGQDLSGPEDVDENIQGESSPDVQETGDPLPTEQDDAPRSNDSDNPDKENTDKDSELGDTAGLLTSNSDFDKDTIVVENDLVKGHIYMAYHRHQKIFASDDHIYKFYFEQKSKEPVLWSSIEDILTQALEKIIHHLQAKYASDKECLVYFTISQDNLTTGLRASPHVLQENSVYDMVQNVMSTFHRYINSNHNVALNDTFEMYFKVLSGAHVNYSRHRRTAVPIRTLVGAMTLPESKRMFPAGGLIDLYAEDTVNNFFPNQCLLIILLYLYFRTVQTNNFEKVKALTKHVTKRSRRDVESGINVFQEAITDFCTKTGITEKGPHDVHVLASAFSTLFKCQTVVLSSMDGSVPTFSLYPSTFDFSLPRLYCFIKDGHAFGILNVTAFFRFFKRKICFTCKQFQYFWNSHRRHKCTNVPSCFLCHGILQKSNFIVQPNENLVYCDREISTAVPLTCQICQNEFKTKVCFDNHFARCQNREMPFYCKLCHTYTALNHQSLKQVQSNHVCGSTQVRCKICYKITFPDHSCEVLKATKCKNWPVMATLTMMFLSNQNSDNCNKCYLLKVKYAEDHNCSFHEFSKLPESKLIVCPNHSKPSVHHLQTNAISVWFETQRFMFEHKTFLDNDLESKVDLDKIRIAQYSNFPLPYTKNVISRHLKGFSRNITSVLQATYTKAEEKFFQFVIKECSNVSFLVENDVTMLKLLDLCLTFNFQPNITQKGSRVFALEMTQIGVRFINFCNYVPGKLDEWLKQFDMAQPTPYFPQRLNTFENMVSNDLRPLAFDSFVEFGDGPSNVENKLKFFDQIKQPVILKVLLCETLHLRSELFFKVVTKYLKQCLDFQIKVSNATNKQTDCNALHPFSGYIMSCSSFTMALCQYFYLNDYSICTVPNPYNSVACPISQGEYEYTSYMAYAKPDLKIKNAFTASYHELRFGHITVDAYSPVNKTVYDFRGDWTHCHKPELCLNPKMKERNAEFCERKRTQDDQTLHTLKTRYASKVSSVETIYECMWNDFKSKNKEHIERFWKSTGLPRIRPLIRLTPRAAVRGGFVETYRLKYLASDTHCISWIDANSLYSFIAMNCNLPIGGFETLTFFDLKDQCTLNNDDGQFYYKGSSMRADIAMVEILVPSSLKKPFLGYRVKDEFIFMANCRTCSEKKLTKPCKHKSHQRSFTSVWTCAELAYAVKELGYVILNWLEVHHYSESLPVLANFVKLLASQKLRHSNIYSECSSLSEKENYCDFMNQKMGFNDPAVKLTLLNNDNPMAKNYFKHALNSLYGRFALHGERVKHVFAKSIHEIQAIASNPTNEILSLTSINDNIIEVTYISKSTVTANRYSNLYYTALINAHGRIFIYNLAKTLTTLGCEILSIDTDAIIFAHLKTFETPIVFSHCFGDFKPVLGKHSTISAYYSLGCRSYIVVYLDENGCQQYLTKVKGLSLTSINNCNLLTPAVFENFINQRFQGEVEKLYIPQSRKKFDPQTRSFSNLIRSHEFSNNVHVKRFIIPGDSCFKTYPYGFDFKNVTE